MATIPPPVVQNTGVRPLSLKNFRSPYFEAFCHNCTWVSFMYPTKEEAIDIADHHAELCCRRINEERALAVEVVVVEAWQLERGHQVLLRDLRTMDIENVNIVDDTVLITYNIGRLESQLMDLPLNHNVSVVN